MKKDLKKKKPKPKTYQKKKVGLAEPSYLAKLPPNQPNEEGSATPQPIWGCFVHPHSDV
jgi:hypothetical protein